MVIKKEFILAIKAALAAGKKIMTVYSGDNFEIETKGDKSPLTIADKKANDVIINYLHETGIPVISEETKQVDYSERKNGKSCWIVDPLDGTKEFIKRNGEFTVNIALIQDGIPVFGVIFAPALNQLYFAEVEQNKAIRIEIDDIDLRLEELLTKAKEIAPSASTTKIRIIGSRSHMNRDTQDFIEEVKEKSEKEIEIVSKGSSLKFCLVAEGSADIYPRFAPTMEWDTAAGQAICAAVGLHVISKQDDKPIRYNRENLLKGYPATNETVAAGMIVG